MVPEPFPIVHLGFLNFPTLHLLWGFLCEVLPWIRVMSTEFYLESYFITNWRRPVLQGTRFLLLRSLSSSPSSRHPSRPGWGPSWPQWPRDPGRPPGGHAAPRAGFSPAATWALLSDHRELATPWFQVSGVVVFFPAILNKLSLSLLSRFLN